MMYEYCYNGELYQLFSVKSFNGSVWNRFNRSGIAPSVNGDGLWSLVLIPANNIGSPVVFRDGLYTKQEAEDCQQDFNDALDLFFKSW